MVTEELYRQTAKEAGQKAAATSDDLRRLVWLEIAKGFERLADVPGKTVARGASGAEEVAPSLAVKSEAARQCLLCGASGLKSDIPPLPRGANLGRSDNVGRFSEADIRQGDMGTTACAKAVASTAQQ
jgi:hypothetical protein